MHVPGSLLRQWNAEDGIADLSSNRSQQGVTGGLWDAIKEFLCTIKGYNIQLLRLYWKAVKPVFDYSSPYWRATDRDSDGWTDLASTCLALPLIFGLLVHNGRADTRERTGAGDNIARGKPHADGGCGGR
ncbi:hypothetical protein FOC1_g10011181 [Fusarium oxysporum f. sp. cubense race 1]|nr:hypothetical protein FOC1_g10011181 [Fusarium oxysporum f. sp. cubense race 1]